MIILYERFASKENIEKKLAELNLAEAERRDLVEILQKLYQQHLLNGILELLSSEDKTVFLEKFYYGAEAEVISFLQEKVQDLDGKIAKLVAEIEMEIFALLEKKK